MNKFKYLLILFVIPKFLGAQSVDLSSVDAFFNVTSTLRSGNEVSIEQWMNFDSSLVYKHYACRENKFVINTIKESIQLVFGEKQSPKIDSLLSIGKEEMTNNTEILVKKLIIDNYLNVRDNYENIVSFRNSYDFEGLINNAKIKLSTFLGHPIDSLTDLKPMFLFFASADAKDSEWAITVDLNLLYRQTEEQRVELLAHEYFHNYRERFENHDFNYKCDLNYMIDMIHNEGVADMIDKNMGYKEYYSNNYFEPDLAVKMVELYNSAEEDLERLNDLIIQYSLNEISEETMVDGLLEIVKFNGHAIGFYMSSQIVNAGYKKQMIETFYDPFEFYKLYNKAAKENNQYQFSDEFMEFVFDK